MKVVIGVCLLICCSFASNADDCIGSGAYQVCTNTSTESNGDITISSHDSEGYNYSITSGSREHEDGSMEAFSTDSEGNNYSIKSWCDSAGCHSRDSDGNTCTVTSSGETIGC